MPTVPIYPAARILPIPKAFRAEPGVFAVTPGMRRDVLCTDSRVARAVDRWLGDSTRKDHREQEPAAKSPLIRVRVDAGAIEHLDGYRLTIRCGEIELIGESPAGCFHGLQTLTQLCDRDDASVTCCVIEDWPDFHTRGLLHDITRGRVPTLATLKLMVDRLALLKANHLQLYIEHAFVFSFDKEICGADEGLTPDEACELGAYCHERFIELAPAMASLGHMGRILSMPKYRHLAEVEAQNCWADTAWPQRARGLTLDCLSPESHRLIENMWSDVMEAFPGPIVNTCGDEPWDLGKGRNSRLDAAGTTDAYVSHLRRVYEHCSAHGRRVQVWTDVLCNHPEMLGQLPKDLTMLHWGYDDDANYDATAGYVEMGFDTVVCPSTSGCKRIIGALGLAERNITTFARRGHECGASGLINTDWGDHGHFNLLGCSWHGIALGAACGWDAACAGGDDFDTRFAQAFWGLNDAVMPEALRRASHLDDAWETWRLFWMLLEGVCDESTLPPLDEAREAGRHAQSFMERAANVEPCDAEARQDIDEVSVACQFTRLFADRIALAHGVDVMDFAERLAEATTRYAALWRVRNKPSGLGDILRALDRTPGAAGSTTP